MAVCSKLSLKRQKSFSLSLCLSHLVWFIILVLFCIKHVIALYKTMRIDDVYRYLCWFVSISPVQRQSPIPKSRHILQTEKIPPSNSISQLHCHSLTHSSQFHCLIYLYSCCYDIVKYELLFWYYDFCNVWLPVFCLYNKYFDLKWKHVCSFWIVKNILNKCS